MCMYNELIKRNNEHQNKEKTIEDKETLSDVLNKKMLGVRDKKNRISRL